MQHSIIAVGVERGLLSHPAQGLDKNISVAGFRFAVTLEPDSSIELFEFQEPLHFPDDGLVFSLNPIPQPNPVFGNDRLALIFTSQHERITQNRATIYPYEERPFIMNAVTIDCLEHAALLYVLVFGDRKP